MGVSNKGKMRTFGELSDEDFIFIIDKNLCDYMFLYYGKIKELIGVVPQNFNKLNVAKIEDCLHPQCSYEVHCNMDTLSRALLKIFQTETISVDDTMEILKTLFKAQYSKQYFK